MSARATWIVGLAGALAVLAALNLLRPRPSGSGGGEPVSQPSLTSEAARSGGGLTAPPAEEADGTPQPEGSVDALRADAPPEANGGAALLPNPAATPMADILAARGMPAPPELLETERTFAAEPRDLEWSTAAETQILGKLAEIPGLALATLQVECRQTLCRLQFAVPRTVADGPPSAEELARLRAGPQVPGIAELVRESGLNGRWVFGFSPVSMAYLERDVGAEL